MTFQPENKLEESLMKAADEPAHRPQFYKDLTESDLLIIQHGSPPEQGSTRVLEEGSEIQIQKMEFNSKLCVPVFSSLTRLQETVKESVGYIAVNAVVVMEITQGADLVLNPGSDYGVEFPKEEREQIIDGTVGQPSETYKVEDDSEVMIGQPSEYPDDLVKSLTLLFQEIKCVKRAYLAHYFDPAKDEKPHTLIGIEVSEDWGKIINQVGLVGRSIEIPDPPLDFVQITGRESLGGYFLNECKPFYKRKKWGIF